nr:14956_t:CDS:2 [Entrophospora candida]
MVIENQIPIEIKKPTELVSELKDEYKVSSFEEFMKTYEYDDNLNYDDLDGGNLGEVKGYEPCTSSYCTHTKQELQEEIRSLRAQISGELRDLKNKTEIYNRWISGVLIDSISSNDISGAKSRAEEAKNSIIRTINNLIERYSR